jgi:hypothetical protein
MTTSANHRARLLADIPASRYKLLDASGRSPCIGDIVVLDQGFTDPEGQPMVLAYFPEIGSASIYEAEVYEAELSSPDECR